MQPDQEERPFSLEAAADYLRRRLSEATPEEFRTAVEQYSPEILELSPEDGSGQPEQEKLQSAEYPLLRLEDLPKEEHRPNTLPALVEAPVEAI